jgi:hypothetical protein
MTESQRDAVFQRICGLDCSVRWLRKYFFALAGKSASVNKLIDTANRTAYLGEIFKDMDDTAVENLSKALTESSIRKKVALLTFTSNEDANIAIIRNKMQWLKRNIVREIIGLSLSFGEFSAEMSQTETDETAVVYFGEFAPTQADDIKLRLSYVMGHLGKENVVVFFKNCELSNGLKNFIHDSGVICERIGGLA